MDGAKTVAVSRRNLKTYAGVQKYRFGEVETEDIVGVTNGLAWTEVGGEILPWWGCHGRARARC